MIPHDLQHLNLRDCELTASGVELVLSAVETAGSTLITLDLSGNELEAAGAERLATFLTLQPQLEKRKPKYQGNSWALLGRSTAGRVCK